MSDITIKVQTGRSSSESYVQYSGQQQHIITDSDRNVFQLGDSALKSAVNAYYGKSPNDAYLCSPTPWGDLYITYGWPEVQTTLVPVTAEVLGIEMQPTIVAKKTLINNSSHGALFLAAIEDNVTNTVTDEWSNTQQLSFEQMINYHIGFLGTGGGGETTFSYNSTWGKSTSQTTSTTVGTSSGVHVFLDPGQAVEVILSAQRGSMKVKVDYKTHLCGLTAVNYDPTYKDHHFHALDIGEVMKSGNISNDLHTTQIMNIGFYCDDVVELRDIETNALIAVAKGKSV